MTKKVALIVPTFNERGNIRKLYAEVAQALDGIEWEVIFVDDDSTDGTREEIISIADEDDRVRCIRRIGRRGLSSACLEGMLSSNAECLAIMDADLQHDPALLPEMLEQLRENKEIDLVVGSRYVTGGEIEQWSSRRRFASLTATYCAQLVLKRHLKNELHDPMSGYFMVRRQVFEHLVKNMSGKGFKILFDLITSSCRPLYIVELPYKFRGRNAGDSKLDSRVILDYIFMLIDKTVGGIIPLRFVMFISVGSLGALLHLGVLGFSIYMLNTSFLIGQSLATLLAMAVNYSLNNSFTHRDRRLKGMDFLRGLLFFYAICAVGAFSNIRVASYLYDHHIAWWFSGLIGAVIGSVWNYAVSSIVVWRRL